MSLIVWYPFTKDFNNKGLSSNFNISNGVFKNTIFEKGLDLSGYYQIYIPELYNLQTFSIAFWIKINSDSNIITDWNELLKLYIINDTNETTTYGSLRFQSCYSSSYTSLAVSGPNNSSEYSIINKNIGRVANNGKNKWYHICFTLDSENNIGKIYCNGILFETCTYTGGRIRPDYPLEIGDIDGTNNGEMNDLRIYDHALSLKEIRELSKGLILHYDLKGFNAGKNILPETPLNGQNPTFDESLDRYIYIRDITKTTEDYIYTGRTQQVEQSTQYTFSTWLWINDNVKSIEFFWLSDTEENQKTGNGFVNITNTSTTGDTISINNALIRNKWNYVTWTFTTKADDYTGYIRYDNNGSKTEGEHAILKVYNPKLEKGTKATPFIPYGLTSDIEEDLSGNEFNGTRQGVTFTPDSPRYYMSTEFDANKDLVLYRIFHKNDEVSNLSVSIWFNVSVTADKNIWNMAQNGFWRHRFSGTSGFQSLAVMGTALQNIRISISPALAYNTWYHNVMTFDNGIFKCYLNGELISTIDKSDVATTLKCSSDTGHWSLGDYNTGSEAVTGKLSDFRIYATTLSAEDIQNLYKQACSIDKDSKLYCGVLVEE